MIGKPSDERGYSEELDQEDMFIPYDDDMSERGSSFGNESGEFYEYAEIQSNDDYELGLIQEKDITEITENRRKHRLEYSYQIPSKKIKNLWSKRDKEAIKEKTRRREEYNKIESRRRIRETLKERGYEQSDDEEEIKEPEIKEKIKPESLKQLAMAKAAKKDPLPLTPLPDRYFHKRSTVRAIAAGYHSLALVCDVCKYAFKSKTTHEKHMLRHKRNKTSFDLPGMMECPWHSCALRSDCTATLIAHLQRDHSQPEFPFEIIMFQNVDEFKLWKVEVERLTTSKFTRSSGKRNVNSISMYYNCHLSGKPGKKSTSQNQRVRRSKKIGRTCPAFMHIKETLEGKVEMRGCLTHCGHAVSVKNIPLTDNIRQEIAQLLVEGENEHDIVDKMRVKYNKSDRRYYLQPYEVRNIAHKMNKNKDKIAKEEELPKARQARSEIPVTNPEFEQKAYECENDISGFRGKDLAMGGKPNDMESIEVKDEDHVPNRTVPREQKVHFEDEPKPSNLMTQFAPAIPAEEKKPTEIVTRTRKNATPVRRSEQRWLRSSEGPSQ